MTTGRTILVGIYSPFASWNIPASHVARLRELFPQHTVLHATSERQALELIPRAQIAFMSEVRPNQFEAAKALEWIHSPAAGVGGMLFPALVESPVVMTNSRGISAATIAEHVLAVTLVMFRKLRLAFRAQAVREWAQDAVLRTIGGSHVLVIGLGAIGTATAQAMAALGAHVNAVRRATSRPKPRFVDTVAGPAQLLDLLPSADVVVVAAPQTKGSWTRRRSPKPFGMERLGVRRSTSSNTNLCRATARSGRWTTSSSPRTWPVSVPTTGTPSCSCSWRTCGGSIPARNCSTSSIRLQDTDGPPWLT